MYMCFTGNFLSDMIQSGTNEKVARPAKVLTSLSGSLAGPVVNDNTDIFGGPKIRFIQVIRSYIST